MHVAIEYNFYDVLPSHSKIRDPFKKKKVSNSKFDFKIRVVLIEERLQI